MGDGAHLAGWGFFLRDPGPIQVYLLLEVNMKSLNFIFLLNM